ncbi:hypothetical protein [uncultured Parolsenella sp.]|uniref:hypothetical protein n=1 Tax=uncultured Parolsenella sp. TaxID=2083008 RepID=UPI0027DD42CE|nr:hypothetical protein [uncultured Parolsenella sp.]
MKRLLVFILTAAVCLCGYATPGFAIEPETTIQLAALEITAPFDPDKVDVIRTYDAPANKVTAKVLDKISGEVLGYQGTVTVTQGNTAGFSYSGLLSAGFGMSGSTGSTWYARKYYSSTVSINLR